MRNQPVRTTFAWVVALVVAAPFVDPSRAATVRHIRGGHHGMGTGGGGGGNGNGGNANAAPAPAAPAAPDPALRNAEAALDKAEQALQAVVTQLHVAFAQGADYARAQSDLAAAQAAYEASKQPVLEKLAATPDYQAALAEKKKAQADRDAAQTAASKGDENAAGGADADAAGAARARAVLDAAGKVTKLETDALAADPGVTAARAKTDAAAGALSKLERQFEASIKENADWQAAKRDVDAAKASLYALRQKAAAR